MNTVYSTAGAGVVFTEYKQVTKDLNEPIRKVQVKGGANVITKNLITPRGVPTQITDDDLAFLEKHPLFKEMKEKGFLTVSKFKKDPDKVAEDMTSKDRTAQRVPGDFKKAPTVGIEKPSKR